MKTQYLPSLYSCCVVVLLFFFALPTVYGQEIKIEKLWEVNETNRLPLPNGVVLEYKNSFFSSNSQTLMVSNRDVSFYGAMLNVENGKLMMRLDRQLHGRLNDNGKYIIQNMSEGSLEGYRFGFWSIETGKIEKWILVDMFVYSATFSPNNRYVALMGSGGKDKKMHIKVFDIESGNELYDYTGLSYPSRLSFCFSPNGDYIVISTGESSLGKPFALTFLDYRLGKIHKELLLGEKQYGIIRSATFDKDGTHVVAHSDGSIRVWRIETGEMLYSIKEYEKKHYRHEKRTDPMVIETVGFTPDGELFFSNNGFFYDIKTGQKVFELPRGNIVGLSKNGEYYFTYTELGKKMVMYRLPKNLHYNGKVPEENLVKVQKNIDKRVAFVVGNNDYKKMNLLTNAINDSKAVAVKLKTLGFEVMEAENADKATLQKRIGEFAEKLKDGGTGLFYYAGHGVQFDNKNYLVPTDADTTQRSCISTDDILYAMENRENAVNILILDACRSNARGEKDKKRTFAKPDFDAKGSFIAFSTSPENIALDGSPDCPRNSVYTCELLKNMKKGVKLEDVFKRTREGVIKQSQNFQIPWEHSSLVGEFEF